jgi:uncharacterized membrane protein YeaQ/YmgE (transglycosylase-associated protein family)
MGFVWFIIMGGIIGWLASLVMRLDASMGIVLNIVVGVVGSFIGGLLLGEGTIGAWPPDWSGLLGALVGAIILLGIINLIRRGRLR